VTCDGYIVPFPDCSTNIHIQNDVVRTNSSYRSVTTVSTSSTGTALGCNLIPPSCTRTVSYGTRTGPAPSEFCILTGVRRATWGRLKMMYR
jgi:hypothetical protein